MQITIRHMDRSLPAGVCSFVHWTATEVDGEQSAVICGCTPLAPKDPSDPTFVPYESITEQQAQAWVQAAMGEAEMALLQQRLLDTIQDQKTPASASGVPWSQE